MNFKAFLTLRLVFCNFYSCNKTKKTLVKKRFIVRHCYSRYGRFQVGKTAIPSLPHSTSQNSDKTAVSAVLPLVAALQPTGRPSVPGKPAGSNITGHSCPNSTNSAVQCMTSWPYFSSLVQSVVSWRKYMYQAAQQDSIVQLAPLNIIVAVTSSGILKAKQKLGVAFNFYKQDVIDFTKFSKMTMCSA